MVHMDEATPDLAVALSEVERARGAARPVMPDARHPRSGVPLVPIYGDPLHSSFRESRAIRNDRLSVILPPTLPSDVSDPINARSDLTALVELITSAGGRMPDA